MENFNNFLKKQGNNNFEEVKEKISQKIDELIHNLEQQKENEIALNGDFPGFYNSQNIEDIKAKIQKEKDLKGNLDNKDYFSQN